MIDPNKLKLVEYLAAPKALRPMSLKNFAINKLCVSEPTVHKWKNLPEIKSAVARLIKTRFNDYVPDIIYSMKNEALAGNVRAAKLFLEFVVDAKEDLYDQRPRLSKEEAKRQIDRLVEKFYPATKVEAIKNL